jgi:urease accessory protein
LTTSLTEAAGEARLGFAFRAGRTRLVRCRTRPPLFVQRALYVDETVPDLALVQLINPTAGVLAGDRLEIDVRVESVARARVATQSATKVYAMPEGCASQTTRLVVDDDAYLEYLPDPVIPFRDAHFAQRTTIELAPRGTIIFADILAPGRAAMGESLAYAQLDNRLTVQSTTGYLLYHEASSLAPRRACLQRRGILGRDGLMALGTFLAFTDKVGAADLVERLSSVLVESVDCRYGISAAPGRGGVIVKALARDTALIQAVFRLAWGSVREVVLKVGLPPVRKY